MDSWTTCGQPSRAGERAGGSQSSQGDNVAHELGGAVRGGTDVVEVELEQARVLVRGGQPGIRASSGVVAGGGLTSFLSENADFAQAVLDAGLNWIGPDSQAIRDLGDKAASR